MTQDYKHPITPPPSELVLQWIGEFFGCTAGGELSDSERFLTTRAAQWGADQELEACCEWLDREGWSGESRQLRAARRPKPQSLKEQALQELEQLRGDANSMGMGFDAPAILRALEQLDD
jgi:hypothetical protein